jgi:hypothetical protein
MPRHVTKHASTEQWKPVTIYEMKKFLGLLFLTGVIRKPKLESYWSTRGILLTPIFSQMMSRNRLQIYRRTCRRDKKVFVGNRIYLLLVKHQDKRLINMISTLRSWVDESSRCTGVTKKKPKCVADYNTHMRGVDTADQYLAYYSFIHKTVKWPKKVFFYLLQCALFNSYVVFTKSNPNSHK